MIVEITRFRYVYLTYERDVFEMFVNGDILQTHRIHHRRLFVSLSKMVISAKRLLRNFEIVHTYNGI